MATKIDTIKLGTSEYEIDLKSTATPSIASLSTSGAVTVGGNLTVTGTSNLSDVNCNGQYISLFAGGDGNNNYITMDDEGIRLSTEGWLYLECGNFKTRANNGYLGGIKPWYSTTGASTYNGGTSAPTAGTDKPNINTRSTTAGRYYPIETDVNGRAYVNVPWADHYAWSDITGKPSTFTPSSHKHTKSDITNLVVFNGTGTYTLNDSGVYLIWNSNSSGDITISSQYGNVTVKGIALAIFRSSAEGDFINIIGATNNTMDHLGTDNGIIIKVTTTTKIYKLIGLGD